MYERFLELTAALSPSHWRLLGVLATEKRLTTSSLLRLELDLAVPLWLDHALELGLLVDAGKSHGFPYARSIASDRAFAIAVPFRSYVLRHLAAQKGLSTVRNDAAAVVFEPSQANYVTALYEGDIKALNLALREYCRRFVREEDLASVRKTLLDAITAPFDGEWLQEIWGESSVLFLEQVLLEANATLAEVGEVYAFATHQLGMVASDRLLRQLLEQSLLRGDLQAYRKLLGRMPITEQLPWRVAECVVCGAVAEAQSKLDDLLHEKKTAKATSVIGVSVAAVLVLLALSREPPAGLMAAKRVLHRFAQGEASPISGVPVIEAHSVVMTAIRTLLRRLSQPDSERLRMSPHHLLPKAPIWEIFILGLTVKVSDCDAVTRKSWARRLVQDAERCQSGGYLWMARQTEALARALDESEVADSSSISSSSAREIMLCDLLEREPEWRIALRALDRFVEDVARSETSLARRVAWYVDMTCGALAKPALEEFREGQGWTRGVRVDFDELRAKKSLLPPEDIAVLTAIDSAPRSGRFPLEGVEALCGHPRVFNGARGRSKVEVLRGTCRVVTRQEHGQLQIEILPRGAVEGVNVVVESESRIVVYRMNETLAKLASTLPTGLEVPSRYQRDALAVLSRLASHVEVDSPELGAIRNVVADATPCLRISCESGAFWVEVGVRPFGELGRFFPPGLGRPSMSLHSGDDLLESSRNLLEEEAQYHALIAQCPTLQSALLREAEDSDMPENARYSVSLGEEELFQLLTELRVSEKPHSLEWKNGRAITPRGKVTAASIHGALRRTKGWYLINGSIDVEQVTPIALTELIRMPYTKTGRYVRMPSGDFLEIEERIRAVLARLASFAELSGKGNAQELRIPEGAFDALESMVELESHLEIDPAVTASIEKRKATLLEHAEAPEGLRAQLRPYQLAGYQWLLRHSLLGHGVCLADDMGLGKTVQAIALLLARAKGGSALVIAPTSVCRNWMDEIAKFAPSLSAVEYAGKGRASHLSQRQESNGLSGIDVVVTSYALLAQDVAELASVSWNTVVLDEAQFIKNPHSLRAKAAFALPARYRVAMTGTPVENHLGDLYSIFHFLNPNLLGSFKHFQLCYLRPIERDRDSEQQRILKELVGPYLLRRRKDEVLKELPPLTTLCHEVRLSDDEAMRYAFLRRQIHEKLCTPHGKRQHKLEVLAEITKLRRFCCHPRLVFPDAPIESSKVQAFLDLVLELRENGHRALVFSQFVDFLDIVREQLDELRISYRYLDGGTPKESRHAEVQAFQNGEAELFLVSLRAGGFGLNLTAADYVIHLDPWWNPAVEAQATFRAHRIGQERPVTVYRLVTKDSIEERIMQLHREKQAIADALLESNAASAELGSDELISLLGLDGMS